MSGNPVLDEPVRYDLDRARARRRRSLYLAFTVAVTGIVGMAVVEGATKAPVYGLDTRTVEDAAGATDLQVDYPRVTRAQLAAGLKVTIRQVGGFGGPITLAVSTDYLSLFTINGVVPEPSSSSGDGSKVLLTFDPPAGDTLRIDWDLAARPIGWFASRDGHVALLDSNGQPAAAVSFHSLVRP